MNRVDKRSAHSDRRVDDIGPPSGWLDRRKRVERRIPETVEIEVSEADWTLYFTSRSEQTVTIEHIGTDIFDRVRD